jgi:predicted HTH transcriptional regulator
VNFVIERNLPEDRLWDLKKTLDMWGFGEGEKEAGQLSFASDISAFANSFGGVIIIGVKDRPREIVGVKPTEEQLNQITNVIGRLTNLPPNLVEVYQVQISSGKFTGRSIIVVCIPQSKETIYIKDKSGNLKYKIRGVSGNEPVKKELIDYEKSNNIGIDNFDFFNEIKRYLPEM